MEIKRGYTVELVGTGYNGQQGFVTGTEHHTASVEFKDGTVHDFMKENLKVLNHDTEIEYGEDEDLKIVKEKYIRNYLGYPENYLKDWTEIDIRKVVDKFNGLDLSKKNRKKIELLDYTIALELQRTVGGVAWLRRRLFQKASATVNPTDLIQKLKDEFGLI